MLCGAVSDTASVSFNVTGNAKLTKTATTAAKNVLSIYKKITVRNWCFTPPFAFARELTTSTNTRIGAIPFNAPTNKSPSTEMAVACGHTNARMTPMTSPITIRRIKLMLFHLLINCFTFFPHFSKISFTVYHIVDKNTTLFCDNCLI